MKILFLTPNFPPEVNAPAVRLSEHLRYWEQEDAEITVLTGPPHFPEGEIYSGFHNRLSVVKHGRNAMLMRVPMYVTQNQGFLKRTLSYLSFMLSAIWFARRLEHKPDVVVATSPHIMCAFAGYFLSRRMGRPLILEVRDLWPESIIAVGALKDGYLIRLLEKRVHHLYKYATHIVVVTESFKEAIVAQGIDSDKIDIVFNGVDVDSIQHLVKDHIKETLAVRYHINGKFIASYIGTVGMAHGVQIILEAARLCKDPDIRFIIAGTGSAWAEVEAELAADPLENVTLLAKMPREEALNLLALSDVSVVHLIKHPVFKTVMPSKFFESIALGKPVVLGVDGEARAIVERTGTGLFVTPENADELLAAVSRLKGDRALYDEIADNACNLATNHYNRRNLASRYWEIIRRVAHA